MGLLLTGEVARSEAKFTRSGSWQKSLIFFIFTRHPWFRACETSPTAAHKQCGVGLWVGYSSLGQRQKNTHRCKKDLLLFEKRFSLQKSKKKKKKLPCLLNVITQQGFTPFGSLATALRTWGWVIVTSDVLKVGAVRIWLWDGLQNLHALRSKQKPRSTHTLHDSSFLKCSTDCDLDDKQK